MAILSGLPAGSYREVYSGIPDREEILN